MRFVCSSLLSSIGFKSPGGQGSKRTAQALELSTPRILSLFRSYLCLCKARISFFAALSAAVGLCLSPQASAASLVTVIVGVFLTACGGCALNHWQEKDADALMERTAKRPIPAGRIEPDRAFVFAVLIVCSGVIVLFSIGAAATLLGLAAIIWYNGVYTWFKRRSAFAAIPGALVGAIPPAIGWIAGGGSILDERLIAVSFFFFMWQVPHFFIHLLAFGKEYERARLPSLTAVFTESQLHRLTFQWMTATAVSLQLVTFFGLMQSTLIQGFLLAVSLWLVSIGTSFMRTREPAYASVFKKTNLFMLTVMIFIFAEKLPGFLL
ncbi:MAG TPA: UbiA family prenyltransferase [Syntrophales bacterium]|nr:UbiA family prenyltransferase [Syntrophales bacterium]